MKISYVLLAAIIAIAGCVQEEMPLKEISIPGHKEIYTFSNDIRDSINVSSNDPPEIRGQFFKGDMNIVFDGSSTQDNAYFTVVVTNIMAKIPTYLAYEGVVIRFEPYYYIGEMWYNKNGDEIERPELNGPALWLKGPSTGAEDLSVNIANNTIVLQGRTYKELTLAGDKLVLEVMGINKLPKKP
ncbi:MAG: hypothetical protein QMD85_03590 [Candidatus Aenigmarchaeota archaeon]|nr:hypothetical protein [Candidatus Aenigmarchaeota archaeon]MDI6722635.1 hypothetical protein [Candidatus Aenigmarchaeota archaeon]